MSALRTALTLLFLVPLLGCADQEARPLPSVFDWANEGPSGTLVRRTDAAGGAPEQFRVSRAALRYYEGPGERGAHLRAGADGLEFLTADGRVWCRGAIDAASRSATLRCDGFAELRVEVVQNAVRVMRDGALWGELSTSGSGGRELRAGTLRYRFENASGAWVATDAAGLSAGSMTGWSRGAGAPLLWLPLPQSPGFGDDRWRALRAAAAWLASGLTDPATAVLPAEGSGRR